MKASISSQPKILRSHFSSHFFQVSVSKCKPGLGHGLGQ